MKFIGLHFFVHTQKANCIIFKVHTTVYHIHRTVNDMPQIIVTAFLLVISKWQNIFFRFNTFDCVRSFVTSHCGFNNGGKLGATDFSGVRERKYGVNCFIDIYFNWINFRCRSVDFTSNKFQVRTVRKQNKYYIFEDQINFNVYLWSGLHISLWIIHLETLFIWHLSRKQWLK